MLKKWILTSALCLAVAIPGLAQPPGKKNRPDVAPSASPTVKSVSPFLNLFKTVTEPASQSTVRIVVDDKDVALGAVVAANGSIITKASEIKAGKLVVKTRDGKSYEGKVTNTNEIYDLAIVKVEAKLTPIEWTPSTEAPVGNWVATVNTTDTPVAVGVVGVAARTVKGPYGAPKVATDQAGYLGVTLDPEGPGAIILSVQPASAAEKAGLKAKDKIIKIDDAAISGQEDLIGTLLTYKANDVVKIEYEREGRKEIVNATLGKRPQELIGPKGKGRGDIQNSMGSTLSERRTGIPTYLQHDLVIKPSECGGPLIDIDGRVIALNIARAGRTETHAIPSEKILELLPDLLAERAAKTIYERVKEAQELVKKAEAARAAADKNLSDAKAALQKIQDEEKWYKDRPLEKGPQPRVIR